MDKLAILSLQDMPACHSDSAQIQRRKTHGISKEKNEIMTQYTRHEGDTGSVEVQVAVLTWEIKSPQRPHQTTPKRPRNLPRGLMKKIGRQSRNLLFTLRKTDVNRYRDLIQISWTSSLILALIS